MELQCILNEPMVQFQDTKWCLVFAKQTNNSESDTWTWSMPQPETRANTCGCFDIPWIKLSLSSHLEEFGTAELYRCGICSLASGAAQRSSCLAIIGGEQSRNCPFRRLEQMLGFLPSEVNELFNCLQDWFQSLTCTFTFMEQSLGPLSWILEQSWLAVVEWHEEWLASCFFQGG